MTYLLDTHILIWYLEGNTRLKKEWQREITNPENSVLISIVSPWEMSLKSKKLRLKLPFEKYFDGFEYKILDITLAHINELRSLPFIHKDPFDRMLVAQARVEGCTIITLDEKLEAYRVQVLH